MAKFVVDASATLPWCFEDEATPGTDNLLNRLLSGDRISVPAHWPTEVSNALLMAVRRNRIASEQLELFWDNLAALPIDVEQPLSPAQAKAVLSLAMQHKLTAYDAAYLELARRQGLPLATLDQDLREAAPREGVVLIAL
jgi:predicted nucleic acid-binding protein